MKRFALLFVPLLLSSVIAGCGESAAPPAGTMGSGVGVDTGPHTKGEAKKNRDKVLEDMKHQSTKK